jgi:hypothetical protein
MGFERLALYGGPDQLMTVTSGLASIVGLLLIFWNKVTALFFRIVRIFKRKGDSVPTGDSSTSNPSR